MASSACGDSSGNSTSTNLNAVPEARVTPSRKRGESIARKTGDARDRFFEDTRNLVEVVGRIAMTSPYGLISFVGFISSFSGTGVKAEYEVGKEVEVEAGSKVG